MPYSTISELPEHVKKHPKKKQRQYMHVWNSVYERTGSEERAFKAANAILKQEAGMDTKSLIEARLESLRDTLEQAGKRLSATTIEKIKKTIAGLEELLGTDEPEEAAVEQAWAPVGEMLLQMSITGEATSDSYEKKIAAINEALRAANLVRSSYTYTFYTWPDHVVFRAEIYDPEKGYQYKTYRADYTVDGDTYTFSNLEEWAIEEVGVAVQSAVIEADEALVQKRADVSDADKKRAAKDYGDVEYADPANKKYPIDTRAHVKAAWSYISMPKNAAKYSSSELAKIKGRIKRAAKKFGIEISEESGQSVTSLLLERGSKSPLLIQVLADSIELLQEKTAEGLSTFEGVATHGNVPNLSKPPIVYPTANWSRELPRVQDLISQGRFNGCLGHTLDANGDARDAQPDELAFKFTQIEQNGDLFPFKGEIIGTSKGKELQALLEAGVALDMSTFAAGKVKKQDWNGQKVYVVQEDGFKWHRTDVVLHGASPGASITDARLQSLEAEEPRKETVMDPEELDKKIQAAITSGNQELADQLQALKTEVEGLGQRPVLSEEQIALLQKAAIVIGRDEERIQLEARDKKIEDFVTTISEIPGQFRGAAKKHFQAVTKSAEEVEGAKDQVLSLMSDLLEQGKLLQSKGLYMPEFNQDGTTRKKLETPQDVIDDLLQSAVEREIIPKDTGVDDPGNPYRNARIMLQTMAVEYPGYAAAYAAMRNKTVKTPRDMEGFLMQNFRDLLQDVPAGAMTTSDLATAIPYLMGIVLDMTPELIVGRYCSVQPMSTDSGLIAYWKIKDESGTEIRTPAGFYAARDYSDDPGEKEQIKRIKGGLTTEAITPTAKKLMWDQSVEVLRRLRTNWGMDGASIMVNECAKQIAMERNYDHLREMIAGATGGNATYGCGVPADASFDGEQWQRQIIPYTGRVRNLIWDKTFAPAVAILGSANSIDRYAWLAKEAGMLSETPARGIIARGVNIVGSTTRGEELVSIGWWDAMGFEDILLFIGRDAEWYRSGYIVAPYLGLYVSPQWTDPNTLDVEQALLSEEATKVANGDFFASLTLITDPTDPLYAGQPL